MNVRRSLAIAAPLVAVAAGIPAYVYAAPDGGSHKADNVAATAAAAPNKGDFVLKRGASNSGIIKGLDKSLNKSGVQKLLKAANNKLGTHCSGARVPTKAVKYCWTKTDDNTGTWTPQGVTSVSDAMNNEKWGNSRYVMGVSWWAKSGARLTFVDLKNKKYRHVLLAYPTKTKTGKPNYNDIRSHVGGIAWYGNYLYVAETRVGMRVFDMRKIFDLGASKHGTTKNKKLVGLHGKTYYGHGYRYVMPQVGLWKNAKGQAPSASKCYTSGSPKFSWVSVDRSGWDSLVTGEYCPDNKPTGRMATWQLVNGQPRTDAKGYAHALAVSTLPVGRVQGGATSTRGGVDYGWFTHNIRTNEIGKGYPKACPKSGALCGQLYNARWVVGSGWKVTSKPALGIGPEDLSCYRTQNRLYTVAEHRYKRALYGVGANC
ncbi:hypothetical protein J4573_46345 [Actinomadura barringtoniae]|uniref:Uncharacterized protein n=1 Tax=Actinomadura barringtoniae TaxID=1427535 RepID=A0A939PQV8_9ACTN|nr:hypothetical protein [Actinomadura barringtoniae]MBO2454578.1 hypothetical protein [Actinomadura barringtoniae]